MRHVLPWAFLPRTTVSARVWLLLISLRERPSDSITLADLAFQPGFHFCNDEVNASLFARAKLDGAREAGVAFAQLLEARAAFVKAMLQRGVADQAMSST
ncbi:hypothetical protein GHV49_16115 [Pseudomonas aeruginosa]|nr:hypothetical protein [Pseudomonas aeruginosa]